MSALRIVVWFLAVAFVGGCDDPRGRRNDGGSDMVGQGPDGTVAGSRSLAVHDARFEYDLSASPRAGHRFLLVDLTLNNAAAESAPLLVAYFVVVTEEGLEVNGHAVTGSLAEGCPTDGSVASGAAYRCSVVFEIANDAHPAAIRYTAAPPAQAALSLSPAPPSEAAYDRCRRLYGTASDPCYQCLTTGPMDPEWEACGDLWFTLVDLCESQLWSSNPEIGCDALPTSSDSCVMATEGLVDCLSAQCASVCDHL